MSALDWIEAAGIVDRAFCLRFSQTLLHFLWQGALVGLLVLVATWCLRDVAARVRYTINLAAMALMVAWLLVTFALIPASPADAPENAAAGVPAEVAAAKPPVAVSSLVEPTAETSLPPEEPFTAESLPVESHVAFGPSIEAEPAAAAVAGAPLPAVASYVTGAYLLGVVLMLLRLGVALWGGHRLKRCATPVNDQSLSALIAEQARRIGMKSAPAVAYCRRVTAPVVVGILKPTILLPTSLATGLAVDQLETIFTHELAHVRRFDLAVNLLQRLVESALFFHPAVWYVSRRVSIERENCCDDSVVSSGYDRLRYAGALIRMAEVCGKLRQAEVAPQGVTLAAAGESPSQFKRRVMRLLGSEPRVRLTRSGTVVVLVMVALLVAAPMAARSWMNCAVGDDRAVEAAKEPEPQVPKGTAGSRNEDAPDHEAGGKQADPEAKKDPAEIAEAVIELLRDEEFTKASDYFEPKLRRTLSAEKLKRLWHDLSSTHGEIQDAAPKDPQDPFPREDPRRFGHVTLFPVKVAWEQGELEFRLAFDDEKISGLWLDRAAGHEPPKGFPEGGFLFGDRVKQAAKAKSSIEIRVLDLYGQPIEQCAVAVWRALSTEEPPEDGDWQDPATRRAWRLMETGSIQPAKPNERPTDGTTTVSELPPGTYRVVAISLGSQAITPLAFTGPMRLDGTEQTHRVMLRMKPGGNVRFQVVDAADGKPLDNPAVWMEAGPRTLPPELTALPRRDANTFEHLPGGRYQFSVSRSAAFPDDLEHDLNKELHTVDVVEGETRQVRVVLKGRPLTEKEITSRWPWIVSGTVTDAAGNSIEGVAVRAVVPRCEEVLGSATTDARGEYTFRFRSIRGFLDDRMKRHVGPSDVVIAASKVGYAERNLNRQGALEYAFRVPTFDDEPNKLLLPGKFRKFALRLPTPDDKPVDPNKLLLPGKPRKVDFVLVPAVDVAVRLLNAKHGPEAEARLFVHGDATPATDPHWYGKTTDERGECFFPDLAPDYAWWFSIHRDSGVAYTPPMKFLSPGKHTVHLQPRVDGATGLDRLEVVSIIGPRGAEVKDRVVGYDGVEREPADAAVQAEGLAILKKLREVNRYWLGIPPSEVKNFRYVLALKGGGREVVTVRDPAKSTLYERRGVAYYSAIDHVARDPDNVIVREIDVENDRITLAYELKLPARVRLTMGTLGGRMSRAIDSGTLVIDPKTHTPLEHRSENVTEKLAQYVEIRDGYYVPLRISVNFLNTELRFRVHHPGLWLLERAFRNGNESDAVAYVDRVSLNLPFDEPESTTVRQPAAAVDAAGAIDALRTRGATVVSPADGTRLAVHFSKGPLSDEVLTHLSKLNETRVLSVTLRGRQFTDADAQALSALPLKRIGLFETRITQKGIDALHNALPDVAITRSGGPFLGLNLGNNVEVTRVARGSASETAGLTLGDRIVSFCGRRITDTHELLKWVSRSQPGDVVDISFVRDSLVRMVRLKVGKLGDVLTEKRIVHGEP
ncbi:MAG: M56 family metallopeptidase [Planctomycetota bacterium]|jgi:beta-lactamase regulating signal transducer with metallopeptidase domain